LKERLEKQQQRAHELAVERNALVEQVQSLLLMREARDGEQQSSRAVGDAEAQSGRDDQVHAVAVQTERRERAEQMALSAARELQTLRTEHEYLGKQADVLSRELAAAETQIRESVDGSASGHGSLADALRDVKILYVGGRPSSTPAIRDVVERHGGEIRRHDGGLEDRKGLLAAGVAWAQVVMFPVDCIDHDSALNLKHLCTKLGVRFVPLRTASVASFVSALQSSTVDDDDC
jgi:hypothetical protein